MILDETGKSQWIRLADVFVVGPLMIWAGAKLYQDGPHPTLGGSLAILGVGTIGLNGYNFYRFGGL